MLNVRLAGDHLYGQLLFTWLSLVMSMMVSFYAVLVPRNVLDEIWGLIESASEGFPVYSHSFYGSVRRTFFFFFWRAGPLCPTYCILQFSKFHVRTLIRSSEFQSSSALSITE